MKSSPLRRIGQPGGKLGRGKCFNHSHDAAMAVLAEVGQRQ